MASPPIPILREKSVCFFVSVSTSSGHFVPKSGVGRGTGAFIYALSAAKPVLRLRLHATQSQPCFPAASNALARPGGNLIFAATPTEPAPPAILLRKVAGVKQAPLWKTSTRKRHSRGDTAFSCYPALRLYRLSKSQRGNGVASLSSETLCVIVPIWTFSMALTV